MAHEVDQQDADHIGRLCLSKLRRVLAFAILLIGALASPLAASPQAWIPPATDGGAAGKGNGSDGFLLSLEFDGVGSNPLPLAGSAFDAASDADPPALVPFAPPVWAGMATLGVLAYVRHKHRGRPKPFRQLA